MHDYISGIQQIGIGVQHATTSLIRYKHLFGMDTLVFDDTSEATLMTCYTGGKAYQRRALLSLNMQGGGGFEIWQFQNRQPAKPATPPQMGDLGIFAAKLKCTDIDRAHETLSRRTEASLSPITTDIKGKPSFWVKDADQNSFQVVTCDHWFQQNGNVLGGVCGAVIGVSNMEQSLPFYKWLLNVEQVAFDTTDNTDDISGPFRRVLLQKKSCNNGAFGKLLGPIQIELVQCLGREPVKIYDNRYWGDCGFIHLCFDVFDMTALKQYAGTKGYTFTIDSLDSFGMEAASGRFCYLEDPDGTLIEMVETHKVPILKKLGLYLNLQKRNLEKPLPNWMIKLLALSKVKG